MKAHVETVRLSILTFAEHGLDIDAPTLVDGSVVGYPRDVRAGQVGRARGEAQPASGHRAGDQLL